MPSDDPQMDRLEQLISELISSLQLEPFLDSHEYTASRVAGMYREVFAGRDVDVAALLHPLIPLEPAQQAHPQLVTMATLRFHSMCQHHFLPFFGAVTISYVPHAHVIGIGKIVSLVQMLARRPQLQEYFAQQIADALENALRPRGLAVHVVARHMCEAMRGTREDSMIFHSHVYRGVLATDTGLQQAFLRTTPTKPEG